MNKQLDRFSVKKWGIHLGVLVALYTAQSCLATVAIPMGNPLTPTVKHRQIGRSRVSSLPASTCMAKLPHRYHRVYAHGQIYYFAARHYYQRTGTSYCRMFIHL